ncbi:MAG: alanine racemase [Byssovorax sp.]
MEQRAAALGKRLDEQEAEASRARRRKGGCAPEAVGDLLAAIARCPHLRAVGLMTVPPITDDPEEARPFFARLRALRDEHGGAAALPEPPWA